MPNNLMPKRIIEFIEPIMAMCESQFPRACSNCQKKFANLSEFVHNTIVVGKAPESMIADPNADPIGLLSYVNCQCGSTLVLRCEDPSGHMHAMFHQVLQNQSKAENKSPVELLAELRNKIRELAGSRAAKKNAS